MSIEHLVPERFLEPLDFPETARNYYERRFRELLATARDKHRHPATGQSDREAAMNTAMEWFKKEAWEDARLMGGVLSDAVPRLAQRTEVAELQWGEKQLRERGEFLHSDELDLLGRSDQEIQDITHAILEPIRHLEVKDPHSPVMPLGS